MLIQTWLFSIQTYFPWIAFSLYVQTFTSYNISISFWIQLSLFELSYHYLELSFVSFDLHCKINPVDSDLNPDQVVQVNQVLPVLLTRKTLIEFYPGCLEEYTIC